MKNLKLTILIFFTVFALNSCKKKNKTTALPAIPYTFVENGDVTNLPAVLPDLSIDIPISVDDIDRETYINGTMNIDGKISYANYTGGMKIKGRGNSTWTGNPKKPYKFKLSSASSLFGLSSSKSWILLAEFQDGSMLYNSIPFTAARLLGMPYTNHFIPVQLKINNEIRGIYAFSEDKEVASNRIDIGDDGVLLEIDQFYDEDWKFHSKNYGLPVMVQFPEDGMDASKLSAIRADFEKFEGLIKASTFPNNDYYNYFDVASFVDYMIVNDLCLNREINQPKSVYMHKKKGGKYTMGIIWDFDWGFGYDKGVTNHYDISTANIPLLTSSKPAEVMYKRLFSDPRIKAMYAQRWKWFKANKYAKLKSFVSTYAETLRSGFDADHTKWGKRGSSLNLDTDLQKALTWLDARANYMDQEVKGW